MPESAPPRVASIGLGRWGRNLADAATRTGSLEIATCFARNPDAREAFASDYGCSSADSFDALLADDTIEGVLIATPHSAHAEQAVAAAEAGKHVFVEKPLALSVDEAARVTRAADDAGVTLAVGYQRRKGAATRHLKAMLDAGELGVLHQLEGNISVPRGQEPAADWRYDDEENSVGGMAALGVHVLDNFLYLAGPIREVFVYSKRILSRSDVDDATVVAMELESGPLGYLGTSLVLPNLMTTVALGTDAVAWSEQDNERCFVQPLGAVERAPVELTPVDVLGAEMTEFAACIRGQTTPEHSGHDSVELAATLEAIRASAATHEPQSVAAFRPRT